MTIKETFIKKHIFIALLVLICLFFIVLIFNTTSPFTISPALILLVFFLIYVSILCSILLIMRFLRLFAPNLLTSMNRGKLYGIIAVGGFFPVFLLALNTISQFSLKDLILSLVLFLLIMFYIYRRI